MRFDESSLKLLGAALVTGLISMTLHAAPRTLNGESSLSKVCSMDVPAPIEQATSTYLSTLTAMGGEPKPMCSLWQEVNLAQDESVTLWKAVAGAFLLHTIARQSDIKPYRAALATLLWQRKPEQLRNVSRAAEAVYADITEHAALGANESPKYVADYLMPKAPAVAKTLLAYDSKLASGPK